MASSLGTAHSPAFGEDPYLSSALWSDLNPQRRLVGGTKRSDVSPRKPPQTGQAQPPTPLLNDVSSRFGRRLREMRHSRALTQADMARKFGIDRSFISEIECGRKTLSLPTIEIIALGMQMSLSELFQGL